MRRWLWLAMLGGCATTHQAVPAAGAAPEPVEAGARAQAEVQRALDGLPRCQPGAEVGHLVVRATTCTRKFCSTPCCNRCGWSATWETMSGPLPAEPARVRALLGLTEGPLECEVDGWARALAGQSLALDAPSCVVR